MKVYVDLDGVLTDLYGWWYKHNPKYQRPNPWPEGIWMLEMLHKFPEGEKWDDNLNVLWWEMMPWMHDGKEILALLEQRFGQKNICILTSCAAQRPDIAACGKYAWMMRELPHYSKQFFTGVNKHFLSHHGALLFDDNVDNIKKFCENGGQGIYIPREWNSGKQDVIKFLKTHLGRDRGYLL
jgi:hypothetical protein